MGPEGKPYLEIADCTWSEDSIRCLHTPSHSARQSFFYVQEIGYASHFIKLFKEHEKTTPLRFRKAWSDSILHYYK